jgi:D-alanyl-D-alanine carboxypeptidase
MGKERSINRPTRGLLYRLFGGFVGFTFAAVLISALTLSEALPVAEVKVSDFKPLVFTSQKFPAPPRGMSFGLSIPSLHLGYFPPAKPVPMASLTKLMTAYVALRLLGDAPLGSKCETVSAADVAAYDHEVATGQSRVEIALGEVLCIPDLIKGLIVHSAGDYALILSHLFGTSTSAFVAKMNETALLLGMENTTYVEPTGINAHNVSNPKDQVILAGRLMQYSIIREAARLQSVVLPVAGLVTSFTPLLGRYHVIGLKSGRTDIAGGCDVMARRITLDGKIRLVLVAVFGARGGDVLTPAGQAALMESQAISTLLSTRRISKTTIVGALSWEYQIVPLTFSHSLVLHSWVFEKRLQTHVVTKQINSALPTNSVVAWVYGPDNRLLGTLRTTKALHSPSLWQRLA